MSGESCIAHQDGGGGCFQHVPDEAGGEIHISGSVGQGGKNQSSDVKTIQSALNDVSPADGGPAVRLDVDGFVGPKTVGAISGFQKRQLGWSDGRIDPGGPTLAKLNSLRGGGGGGGGGGVAPAQKSTGKSSPPPAATADENKAFIQAVGRQLPTAASWVSSAQFALNMSVDLLLNRLPEGMGGQHLALVDKYYHVLDITGPNQVSRQLAYLEDLRKVFLDMRVVISQSRIMSMNSMTGIGVGFFQPDPNDGTPASKKYDAFTYFGGWNAKGKNGLPRMSKEDNYSGKNLRQDTIFFPVSHYGNKTDEYVTTVILHELAHFVGPGVNSPDRIGDHSNIGQPNFLKLSPSIARRTADIYAHFAAEAALKRDPVIFK